MLPRGQRESNTQDLTRPVPSPQTLVGPTFSFLPPNGASWGSTQVPRPQSRSGQTRWALWRIGPAGPTQPLPLTSALTTRAMNITERELGARVAHGNRMPGLFWDSRVYAEWLSLLSLQKWPRVAGQL